MQSTYTIVKRKTKALENETINKKKHNECTAFERSVINYLGVGVGRLKLALRDPISRPMLP